MKVVFVVSKFPCYDEAFILRELYALSKQVDIFIFSLRKSKDKTVHDEASALLARTIYVPYFFSRRVLGSNIRVFFRYPVRYLTALLGLVFGNLKSFEFLWKNVIFFPKAVYLADFVRREGIDHIHAYWATYPASVAYVASQITKRPFSFTGHAHDIYLNTTSLKRKITKAKFVATCTEKNKEYLKQIASGAFRSRGVPPRRPPGRMPGLREGEKILVIHHGIDLEKFAGTRKARAEQSETIEILSVGTLQWHKGFEHLIKALSKLKERAVRFHATIIGGGPLAEDLQRHIRFLKLQDVVTMTGPLKQDQVIPYYKQADIKVLMAQPEWHWGIPNVFIEALAAKVAVVTTRFGSVEELIEDGVTGVIVPSKDDKALADVLEKLCRDDHFRIELAERGHQRVVQNFDLGQNVKTYLREFSHNGLYEALPH